MAARDGSITQWMEVTEEKESGVVSVDRGMLHSYWCLLVLSFY